MRLDEELLFDGTSSACSSVYNAASFSICEKGATWDFSMFDFCPPHLRSTCSGVNGPVFSRSVMEFPKGAVPEAVFDPVPDFVGQISLSAMLPVRCEAGAVPEQGGPLHSGASDGTRGNVPPLP